MEREEASPSLSFSHPPPATALPCHLSNKSGGWAHLPIVNAWLLSEAKHRKTEQNTMTSKKIWLFENRIFLLCIYFFLSIELI